MQATIVVDEVKDGKFGPYIVSKDREFYNFGKFYDGPRKFNKDEVIIVDLFVTEKGNKYLNKYIKTTILGETKTEAPKEKLNRRGPKKREALDTTTTSSAVVFKPRDFELEAYGKCKFGLIQSLFPMMVTNPHDEKEVKEKVRYWALAAMEDDRILKEDNINE